MKIYTDISASMVKKPQFKKFFWAVLAFSLLSFGCGYVTGAKRYSDFAQNGKTESKTLGQVKQILDESFVSWNASTSLPTDKELELGMVKGYVDAYKDPYTTFFPPVQAKSFQQEVKGSFGGVGMQVEKKGEQIVVTTPLKDSPAMKGGVLAGDTLLAVDGISSDNKTVEEVVNKIRGEIGTEVKLQLMRKEGPVYEVKLVRSEIKIPTVETQKKDGVFIVRVFNFSEGAPDLFKSAMNEFREAGTQYMVLDLRGNPGGYLEAAVKMGSYFFPEGTVIVKEGSKTDPSVESSTSRSYGYDYLNSGLRMVVLVDQGSASAAEILAGALKDYHKATVVGKTTYGKGSVQKLVNFDDGSSLKVTVASWFTPNGTSISLHGIKPDVDVDLDLEKYKKDKTDTQLNKAIEVVKGLK